MSSRTMAQVVSRQPPTTEARVRSRVSPCGICGGQNGIGTGSSPNTSVFSCQFHSTGAPLLGKGQKITIIIIVITGLHNKPQGCGASVASAAGSFTPKKKSVCRQDVYSVNDHSAVKNTHAFSGNRTRSPNNQAASHQRLRPHGHRDRSLLSHYMKLCLSFSVL
jgi:hypothetical protein